MKEFDYYIFIDYSKNFIGYMIIEKNRIAEFLPKISKFAHYKELKHKSAYIHSIKKVIEKNKVLDYFIKYKLRETRENIEIYFDVLEFLKKHENCIIFISVDDHEYSNFQKFVHIVNDKTVVRPESKLLIGTPEYHISLVLDTILNIERLKHERN